MWPVTPVYPGHVAFFPETQLCPVGLGASTASLLPAFPFLPASIILQESSQVYGEQGCAKRSFS